MNSKILEFVEHFRASLSDDIFVKISLANYKGSDQDIKKIHAKRILIKNENRLSFTYQYKTRDIVKNYSHAEAVKKICDCLDEGFNTATLLTTGFNLQFEKKGTNVNIKKTAATNLETPANTHDKQKIRLIDSRKTYLQNLKITDKNGEVYKNAQDKFRQINRYVELLDPLIKTLPQNKKLKVADMGSGKGYLTFALYDHMTHNLKLDVDMTGVEYRADMVDLCNKIATETGFAHLHFLQSSIEDFNAPDIDILIALHACDTATDDAIFKGIKAEADLIVVAPCCHKQIRKEMDQSFVNNEIGFLTKHGIFMERQAEMITDGLRAEILQYAGYTTKIFEFISAEHTTKNVMITAIKNLKLKNNGSKILESIQKAKKYFGIKQHRLESLLNI